jgi:hypothetical protein
MGFLANAVRQGQCGLTFTRLVERGGGGSTRAADFFPDAALGIGHQALDVED